MEAAAVDEQDVTGNRVPGGFVDRHMEGAAYDMNQLQLLMPVIGHSILRVAFRNVVVACREVCGSVMFYFFVFYIMHNQNHQFLK